MMYLMTFHVQPGEEAGLVRERLAAAIKSMGHWSNRMPDMWLLEPSRPLSAAQIRDHLKQFMGPQDAVLVARISRNWAGRNMGAGFPDWMRRREFGTFLNPAETSSPPDTQEDAS